MKFFIVVFLCLTTNFLFAETARLNRATITQKTYSCSNGGTIVLQDTRFGNVKRAVFSKRGQSLQYNYVRFWNSTDHYEGQMVAWMKFPSGPITEDNWPQEGRHTADMTIYDDGKQFIMIIKPFSMNSRFNGLSCVGL